MVQAQRKDRDPHGNMPFRSGPADSTVAQLQADLAQRLLDDGVIGSRLRFSSTKENQVHAASIAGGYLGLAFGYIAVGVAIAYWVQG